jgi:hypothetical protein
MTLFSLVCLLLIAVVSSWAQNKKLYLSPDRVLKAVVWTGKTGESRVEIQTTSERVLLVRDETSSDGAHGQGVVHAAWTTDSQFFVVSTESSGGHQPWARPIWVYSRANNQILELGKLGATAVADFALKPPDVIQTKVLDCESGKGDLASRPLVISLHQVVANGRLPKPPCPAQ